MISQVVIVAGGDETLWPEITTYQGHETFWIGVDRGAYRLLKKGIVPDLAVGDFDSLSSAELKEVEGVVSDIHYSIPEKDDTDTQLGLKLALAKHPQADVLILGATGGRLDHFLSNLWLPLDPRFEEELQRIKLIDEQNTITYFLPGDYVIEKEADKKYLAYVCLTAVTDLSLYDAKYRLENYQVPRPMSFASNEFIGDTSHFSFTSGVVAVIQSKDL
ncbi:MAG: thiamine diphosphokinase [Vagococcus salmoninarum]|uniref:thiamine diphosphokinase n=1 Tax=Vagococcus salmoninarum TaxID=2739 RepID=UPI003F946B7F